MYFGFSDLDESYEYESNLYDMSVSMIGTSDDSEYAESESKKYDEDCSLLG